MRTHKIIFALFCFLQLAFSMAAQLPSIDWGKKFGSLANDSPESIKQLPDSSFIVLGTAHGQGGDVDHPQGAEDAFLLKLSAKGEKVWTRSLGGSGTDQGLDIQTTPDGGFILVGVTHSNDGGVTGNHGAGDAWVVKMDSLGNIKWQKCLGGSNYDGASSVQLTADGGYILAGFTRSSNGDVTGFHPGSFRYEFDMWVVKLTATGSIEWKKALGGSGNDYATSVAPTPDGGYVVTGSTASKSGNVRGLHGGLDMWVVKLGNTGVLQWQKCLGGSLNDHGQEILPTPDGGYIIAGSTDSKDKDVSGLHGKSDFWVVKLNSAGTLQWQKCLGGIAAEFANTIQLTTDGGYVVGGYSNSKGGDIVGYHFKTDGWLVKVDSIGKLIWQRCFGGTEDDFIHSLIRTSDGKYAFAGSSFSSDGDLTNHIGNNDYWIVKIGNNGAIPQNTHCDSINMCLGWLRDTIARSLEGPESHKIVVVEHAKWDGADIIFARSKLTGYEFYDVIFDCQGRVLERCYQTNKSSSCDPFFLAKSLLYNGDDYTIKYGGIATRDTVWHHTTPLPPCQSNAWVVKPTSIQVLQTAAVLTTDINNFPKETLEWSLYPNPANSQITVQFGIALDNGILEIMTIDGKILQQIILAGQAQKQSLEVATLPTGIYWCKVTTDRGVHTKRFVITR